MDNTSAVGFQLSPVQQLVWPARATAPAQCFCRIIVDGELDAERLRNSFRAVIQRHESLRTTFQQPSGFSAPFQVIGDTPELAWNQAATPGENATVAVQLTPQAPGQHVLEVSVSSLCTDVQSFHNLIDEVAAEYARRPAADEPVQYADFSAWHAELLSDTGTEDFQAAKEHWSVSRPPQRLPFERLRAEAPAATASYSFDLGSEFLAGVQTELPVFLFGCWQALLWRLTSQESITVSYVSAGRASEELRSSIGLFSNPLPVTCSFEDQPSFSELFHRSQAAITAAEQWQYYCPAGSQSEAGFEFWTQPDRNNAADVSFSIASYGPRVWPFQLSLAGYSVNQGVRLELTYNAARFTAEDIARIAQFFERTVEAAAQDPSAPVSAFDLLDAAGRAQIVAAASGEQLAYSDGRTLPQLFEAQAALTPDRTALVFETTELTYAQLNARANQIAHYLQQAGVGPNVKVGLCLERSAEMIVAVLGVLKAGGAYVPLLPDMPKARLTHQLSETEAPVIITTEKLLDKLPEFTGRVLCLDRDRSELGRQPETSPASTATASDLIYVLYTSGSTGTPKGVAVRHGNVTNYTRGMCRRMGLRELSTDDGVIFATVSTLGADLGNTAIFPALVTGGCLCVISYEAALDGHSFAEQNRRHPIDILKITPSNLNALLVSGDAKGVLPRRLLIVGGEACSWDLARLVHQEDTCAMMNHYGPTEATIGCLTYAIQTQQDPAEEWSGTVPLGRPIPNMQVYVLDSQHRPVPAGVAGEICVSGAGIADGYIGRAEETRQRFIAHPFLPDGGLLYCTGDRGRVLPGGSIEFLGRTDDQVKIRGHRVELAEIEAVLNGHAKVRQSLVAISQDDAGQHLTAYLIANSAPPAGELESYLRQRLPEYMIPGSFITLDQFPLNANGKIDRRKLAETNRAAGKAQAGSQAPRNPVEEKLAGMWREVLKVERVGITDNFFELGGHSLLATLVVSRIRSAFDVQIPIRTLFESPTIESLAVAIEATRGDAVEDPEIFDLLSEIEGLSDQETRELLETELGRTRASGGKN